MKNKIILAIPIMLTIVCIFSLNVFANEPVRSDSAAYVSESGDTLAEDEITVTPMESGENSAPENDGAPSTVGEVTENVFSLMLDEAKKYFSEILCFFTFITSVVVALAYKKGLVPILEGGLAAISRAVTKIKDKSDESDKEARQNYTSLEEKIKEYESALSVLNERVVSLTDSIAPLSDEVKNNELIEKLITSQTRMLYDVFMASSLPSYQKDKVEAHYKEMIGDIQGEE